MTKSNKVNCSVTDVKHNFDSNELTIYLLNIDKYYENVNDLKFVVLFHIRLFVWT